MTPSLDSASLEAILSPLRRANQTFGQNYPGIPVRRQPIHTVYGGAHLFRFDLVSKMSRIARDTLKTYAPDPAALVKALGVEEVSARSGWWPTVLERVTAKLEREAVEDFRIDFEDGYGNRPAEEEDGHARSAAGEVARGMKEGTLPPFLGIRIKPLNDENYQRGLRTLDIFLGSLLQATGGKLPPGFVVTLPKITIVEQSRALAQVLTLIEKRHGLKSGEIPLEIMIEMPQAVLDDEGRCPLREFVGAAEGRCLAAHFGTYDYTAGCQITATYQAMDNPACDFAKHVLQVALAGTSIFLSDGATTILPIGPYRETPEKKLTTAQIRENTAVVHAAWRLSYRNIRHSLRTGYYQGWDLHPTQLPVRYAAIYAFFLESIDPVSARMKAFVDKAAKATLLGDVFDDAATGQGLLNFFLRGLSCGAISETEVKDAGLTLEDLRDRSFLKMLERRKNG